MCVIAGAQRAMRLIELPGGKNYEHELPVASMVFASLAEKAQKEITG
jgi:hypothetical protein